MDAEESKEPMSWEIHSERACGRCAILARRRARRAMDSEQFAAFYARSARSLWAYLARVSRDPGTSR